MLIFNTRTKCEIAFYASTLLFLRDVLASIDESTKLLLKLRDNDSIVVLFLFMF